MTRSRSVDTGGFPTCQQVVSSDPTAALRRIMAPRASTSVSWADVLPSRGDRGLREGMRMAWHARGQGFKSPQLHPHNPLSECPCPESMNAAPRSGVICQQVIPSGCRAGRVRPPDGPSAHRFTGLRQAVLQPRRVRVPQVVRPPWVGYAISSQQGRQLGHPASARSSSTIVARPPKTMAAPTR